MTDTEFSRPIKVRVLPGEPVSIAASEAERAALADRFAVTAIDHLTAEAELCGDGEVITARGRFTAEIAQPCAVSGETLRYSVDEALDLRFVPAGSIAIPAEDEEVAFDSSAPDDIEYEGDFLDLGEAVAQSLGLALDPYRTGPAAEEARAAGLVSSEEASGPFAALAALRKS